MILALSAPMAEQAAQLDALKGTPAEHEPLYLWLAAHRGKAAGEDLAQAVRFAEQARDTLRCAARCRDSRITPGPSTRSDLEGRILELLSDVYLQADNPESRRSKTIEHLCKTAPNHMRILKRAELLCGYFPERREEAFDDAYQWSRFGGYEDIMAFPGYEDYEAQRKAGTSSKGLALETRYAGERSGREQSGAGASVSGSPMTIAISC